MTLSHKRQYEKRQQKIANEGSGTGPSPLGGKRKRPTGGFQMKKRKTKNK